MEQCNGTQTVYGQTGNLQDHIGLYGVSHYTNNASCGWLINVDIGRVQFAFELFNLAAGDYLTIYDGMPAHERQVKKRTIRDTGGGI